MDNDLILNQFQSQIDDPCLGEKDIGDETFYIISRSQFGLCPVSIDTSLGTVTGLKMHFLKNIR